MRAQNPPFTGDTFNGCPGRASLDATAQRMIVTVIYIPPAGFVSIPRAVPEEARATWRVFRSQGPPRQIRAINDPRKQPQRVTHYSSAKRHTVRPQTT